MCRVTPGRVVDVAGRSLTPVASAGDIPPSPGVGTAAQFSPVAILLDPSRFGP